MEKTHSGHSARDVREGMPPGVFWSIENYQSSARDNQSFIFTNPLFRAGNPLQSLGN